jgi:transketolase C-terminal domain/subunit
MPEENKESSAIRDGFGKGLIGAGEKDERIVVLSADVTESRKGLLNSEWQNKIWSPLPPD